MYLEREPGERVLRPSYIFRHTLRSAVGNLSRIDRVIKERSGNIGLKGLLLFAIMGGAVGVVTTSLTSYDSSSYSPSRVQAQAAIYHTSFGNVSDISGFQTLETTSKP